MTKRPLIPLTLFFCGGILFGKYASISLAILTVVAFICLAAALILRTKKYFSEIFILFSFLLLGTITIENFQYAPKNHVSRVAQYYKKVPVRIEGRVVSDVQKRNLLGRTKTIFTLETEWFQTKWGWQKKQGKILVNVFRDENISYGDVLELEGRLYRPFNFSESKKFSYKDYLNNRQIKLLFNVKKDGDIVVLKSNEGNIFQAFAFQVKGRLNDVFVRYLSKNESGLMQALILGDRYDIPKHINQLFVQTGTAHILAISGFNVGIVAAFAFLILKMFPMGHKAQSIMIIILLVAYAFLTGLRPPVVRATIMAVVFIVSFLIERETDGLNTLALAALILLLGNPSNLFDIGFQLSFVSVFFILLFYAPILGWFSALYPILSRQPFLFLSQSLIVSLVAWLGVAGLIAYYFEIVTPVTVVANLIVIPLISAITILGLGLLLMGSIPFLAVSFAYCIKFLLNVTIVAIYCFSRWPFSHFYVDVSWGRITAYYFFIFGVFWGVFQLIKLTKNPKYGTVTA